MTRRRRLERIRPRPRVAVDAVPRRRRPGPADVAARVVAALVLAPELLKLGLTLGDRITP